MSRYSRAIPRDWNRLHHPGVVPYAGGRPLFYLSFIVHPVFVGHSSHRSLRVQVVFTDRVSLSSDARRDYETCTCRMQRQKSSGSAAFDLHGAADVHLPERGWRMLIILKEAKPRDQNSMRDGSIMGSNQT